MKTYELTPEYASTKSFYGKAKVTIIETNDTTIKKLYSYGTLVMAIVIVKNTNCKTLSDFGYYSNTTSRHQKEFLLQEGYTLDEIQEIFKERR